MAKQTLISLCVLVAFATVSARPAALKPLTVTGNVNCDTCRLGYETSLSTKIEGAEVVLDCKRRSDGKLAYTDRAVTDSSGNYKFVVRNDQGSNICEVSLVKSPLNHCSQVVEGRDRTRVILTSENGISSEERYANAMLFMKSDALPECEALLQQYKELAGDDD